MKIPVIYSHHSAGCAPTYTIKALERLGHDAQRMSPDAYFAADPNQFDFFFCQDSGDGIDFRRASPEHLKKTSMWYWDSAWNYKQRQQWGVGDFDMAEVVINGGGWVFWAWQSDMDRFRSNKQLAIRSSWLPVAGDPISWPDMPAETKIHKLSMIGNCYDSGRARALSYARDCCELFWPGPQSYFYEDAAKVYRQSWAIFHPPTFYQLPHDYTHERVDLIQGATMRHYEALCCGVPLITTHKYDFEELGFVEGEHVFTWEHVEQIPAAVDRAVKTAQDGGAEYSKRLKQLVLDRHTYEHRMVKALGILKMQA
jgi:hypothetical protein